MELSKFNINLGIQKGNFLLFNALAAQFCSLNEFIYSCLAKKKDPGFQFGKYLLTKGIITNNDNENQSLFSAIKQRQAQDNTADITLLPPADNPCGAAPIVEKIGDYLDYLGEQGIAVLKIRIPNWDLKKNGLLQDQINVTRDYGIKNKLAVYFVLMCKNPCELFSLGREDIQNLAAVFFPVSLKESAYDKEISLKVLKHIGILDHWGKSVFIQFLYDQIGEIDGSNSWFAAIKEAGLIKGNSNIKMGIRKYDNRDSVSFLYPDLCFPRYCSESDEDQAELYKRLQQLNREFIPVGFKFQLFHKHPGCLYRSKYNIIFDGRCRSRCYYKYDAGSATEATGCSAEQQLSSRCLDCSYLPLCLAECPFQLSRENGDCEKRKKLFDSALLSLFWELETAHKKQEVTESALPGKA